MSIKAKIIVVGGWENEGKSEMIQALGAFDNLDEAYGKAYLYLTEFAENDDYRVTPPIELEGESGYGMYLKNEKGETGEYAYILFNDYEEDEENAANT